MSLHLLGAKSAFDSAQETVAAIDKKVSPWLWILSVTSFATGIGFGLWNKYQINHMFGSYKRMKDTLWRK